MIDELQKNYTKLLKLVKLLKNDFVKLFYFFLKGFDKPHYYFKMDLINPHFNLKGNKIQEMNLIKHYNLMALNDYFKIK